ncbi:MAG: hypothetical protein WC860_01265, partial [Candidatus Margulisiibacteriota bacterium]
MKPQVYIQDLSLYSEEYLTTYLNSRVGFVYLDSNESGSSASQFSFICFEPFLTFFVDQEAKIHVTQKDEDLVFEAKNSLEILEQYLKKYQVKQKIKDTPFYGGAVGYFSYEAHFFISKYFSRSR